MIVRPLLALLVTAISLPGPAASQSKVERHAGTPPALILQSVSVKPGATMVFVSGQVPAPLDPAKATLPNDQLNRLTFADFGDTKTQTISALAKIKAVLAAQGFAMSDIVKLNVFVVGDPKLGGRMDFAGMNEGFKTVFGTAETPVTVARSTVQVAGLAGTGFLVEIEAIAAK